MRTRSETEQSVVEHFFDEQVHMAPSQIDFVLGLRKGTAHDIICETWLHDGERYDAFAERRKG